MSKILVLYKYNKYYNRIIKKLSLYSEYKALITPVGNTPAALNGFEFEGNFNFSDGVYAQHIINIASTNPMVLRSEQPDYLVLQETYKEGNTERTKLSRWFIMESDKTMGGQFQLTLRRDLLADFYESVTKAPVFIQKGFVNQNLGVDDPSIFNKESMTYNQIKKGELLLNFNKLSGKGGGWIIGYLAKEDNPTALSVTGQAAIPPNIPNWTDLPSGLRSLITAGVGYKSNDNQMQIAIGLDIKRTNDTLSNLAMTVSVDDYGEPLYGSVNAGTLAQTPFTQFERTGLIKFIFSYFNNETTEIADYLAERVTAGWNSTQILSAFNTIYTAERGSTVYTTDYSSYDNTYFKDSNNKLCRLRIVKNGASYYRKIYTASQVNAGSDVLSSSYKSLVNSYILNTPKVVTNTDAVLNKNTVCFARTEITYSFIKEEVNFSEIDLEIPADRNSLLDAPYDMFCIPAGEISVKSSGSTILTTKLNDALAIARAIAVKGAERIYDIQYLPYCPFPEAINSDGDIDITGLNGPSSNTFIDYAFILDHIDNTKKIGICLFPLRCKGTFDMNIPSTSDVYNDCLQIRDSVIEKKIASETKFVRFVSPNYASMFDINVQKNNGIVNLNVDYFYKPYCPYIHVAPYFSGLYGNDYNDPKGLICSGDFSISTAMSKWEEYQLQNKNFQESFDRSIQNLDVNNSIAYNQAQTQGNIGVASSFFMGMAAGALAGSGIGSVPGAIVGGIIGGVSASVTSLIGKNKDLDYLRQSQSEARSNAIDQFSYSLGNIKALPNSLTRVTAFTENFKIFPFLEFYDCTDEEKEALRNKLKYDGFTIMRIGKIEDFAGGPEHYVQGQLIRLEGVDDSSRVVAELANEVKEGAYYYGTYSS